MTEVRIGVIESPKELNLEMTEDADDVIKMLESAISGDERFIWVKDRKGKRVGIPIDRLAYVEILSEKDLGRVGFGAAGQ